MGGNTKFYLFVAFFVTLTSNVDCYYCHNFYPEKTITNGLNARLTIRSILNDSRTKEIKMTRQGVQHLKTQCKNKGYYVNFNYCFIVRCNQDIHDFSEDFKFYSICDLWKRGHKLCDPLGFNGLNFFRHDLSLEWTALALEIFEDVEKDTVWASDKHAADFYLDNGYE